MKREGKERRTSQLELAPVTGGCLVVDGYKWLHNVIE